MTSWQCKSLKAYYRLNCLLRPPSEELDIDHERTWLEETMAQYGPRVELESSAARAGGVPAEWLVLPGDTIAGVIDHVQRTMADARVRVVQTGAIRSEPSPISDTASPGYQAIERAIAHVYPGVAIVPSLVLGMTDSRHYSQLGCPCYRFSPLWHRPEDPSRVHGVNERIAVEHYARAVGFYTALIRTCA